MSGCQESLMSGVAPSASPIILTAKEKKCTNPKCQKIKLIEEFGFIKGAKDGRSSWCRECSRELSRIWRKKNPKKNRATIKKWVKLNPEKRYESNIRWRNKNPEKVREFYLRANIKKRSTSRGRLNSNIANSIRFSLRGNKKGNHWESIVGYTVEQLEKHLEKQFKDGMSWENYGKWHIDHIIPISVFNFEKPEDDDFKRCWALKNLQPLWSEENIKKSNKLKKYFQPRLTFK